MSYIKIWAVAELILSGRIIALNAYIRRKERSKTIM